MFSEQLLQKHLLTSPTLWCW